MILQKIILYLSNMITETQFIDLYNSNYNLRRRLLSIVDESIKSVDFQKYNSYKWGLHEKNQTEGVLFFLFNKWIWGWMNSINTNYSCIFLIIDYINKEPKFTKKITLLDFSSINIESTLSYIRECVLHDKQIIFTPGSSIFKDMFFTTQYSWNRGIISILSAVLTIKENFNIQHIELSYERGDKSDMTKGMDLGILFDGKISNTQHKSAKLSVDGDYYTSKRFIYNELTYRNNLDLISIESGGKIFLFYNSKDKNLCGTRNGEFFIHKNLKITEMSLENKQFTELLTQLNRMCFEQKIMFMFERGETGANYFDEVVVKDKTTIRFFLNDIHDSNLINMVKEQIEKLQ